MCRSPNNNSNSVCWINLREEPVVYINNRPYVLRELEFPFRNMIDFQGKINYFLYLFFFIYNLVSSQLVR